MNRSNHMTILAEKPLASYVVAHSMLRRANQNLLVRCIVDRRDKIGKELAEAIFTYAMRDKAEWTYLETIELGNQLTTTNLTLGEWLDQEEQKHD